MQLANDAPVDLVERLARFDDRWSPKVVARMNDYEVKLVKVEGEFGRALP